MSQGPFPATAAPAFSAGAAACGEVIASPVAGTMNVMSDHTTTQGSTQDAGGHDPMSGEVEMQTSRSDGEVTTATVSQPAKLVRIGNMLGALQQELRALDGDDVDRDRLLEVHRTVRDQLDSLVSGALADELHSMVPPLEEEPTSGELRVAQAQLIGWVEGLLHGVQAALAHQQQGADDQLAQLRQQQVAAQQAAGQGDGQRASQTPGYL